MTRPYRWVESRMRDSDSQPAGEPCDLSLRETRKAVKRRRYATDAVAHALGKPAARL